MNTPEDEVTHELLNTIEKISRASQRDLVRHAGIALGLVQQLQPGATQRDIRTSHEMHTKHLF